MQEPFPEMGVLLIDDEPDVLHSVGAYLKDLGHRVHLAESGSQGLEILRREAIDIVVTDFKMPGMDGFEVLHEVKVCSPETEVIMITAYGDIDGAVKAMREGAFDFFSKPVKLRELTASMRRTVRFQALRREKERYKERLQRIEGEARQRFGLAAIIGQSDAMDDVRRLIEQVCGTNDTTVLITGETGTGKELVARAIHHGSARCHGPFVAVDCSAVPQTLFESSFYGHEKGAFTDARDAHTGYFEQADGGTLFLDEIGDLDLNMQTRLLRTLEQRSVRRLGSTTETPVDIRIVSATNRDLPRGVASGEFRRDLFFRLNTLILPIAPLREHAGDIESIAIHYLERYRHELHKSISGFSAEAMEALRTHPFTGNVRELKNTVERAVIICQAELISKADLQIDSVMDLGGLPGSAEQAATFEPGSIRDLHLSDIEKALVQEALSRSKGNQVRAAGMLGISRDALRRRMERYDIQDT
jgi:DNA-binding NtrC family response regulator